MVYSAISAVNNKYIIKTNEKMFLVFHITPDTPRPKPADEHVMASTGGDVQVVTAFVTFHPNPDYAEEEAVPPGLDEADRTPARFA